ncbi:DUF4382 domain-containing protein [Synechococcales cyanobacterium C]|uniref:DUF4382 domain-containing protein n=1 Tax=Petrachloros mirabilis ULC683 TaxID=2781853 RepID=A0A8K1ZWN3_9CYAN|nr:DUF4382 domain-containing protein [Petrachloros mirabilis]NCJ05252.1 DUF4382 domain-containing protein [Petrachloros mirabilis ULC683]
MTKRLLFLILIPVLAAFGQGCDTAPEAEAPVTPPEVTEQTTTEATGTLQIRANGEERARDGFTSKDGWELSFDHIYVNLAQVTAYQTDPPFNPERDDPLQAEVEVTLPVTTTVDIAETDPEYETVLVGEITAPAGQYNALSWVMQPATTGPAEGYALVLLGTATQNRESIDFALQIEETLAYQCGDFVGDERKGILVAGETADLEATFHLDHLFGDSRSAPDDSLNQGALGFEPLAALAENGRVEASMADLQTQLSGDDYDILRGILAELGHAGEGHCRVTDA